MRHGWLATVVTCIAFVAAGSCKSKSTSPSSSTTFQGVIAAANGQSGTVTVVLDAQVASAAPIFRMPFVATLDARATVNATGTVHVAGGATTSLSGTYDSLEKSLSMSGNGFTFGGLVSSGVLTGTYSGTGGATGTFAARSTAGGSVTAYCGNVFSSGVGQGNVVTGVFNVLVTDGTGALSGAFNVPPARGYVTGQVTGTAFTLTYTDTNSPQSGTGTGTIQGGSLSGTSSTNNPFSGSTSKCQ